jgi:vacuolar-type H+-ATPase subunit I/STV1
MKTLTLSLLAVAGLALVGWQHQQLGQLRAEKETLQKSATEADQLKSDLAKFDSAQSQDVAAEIDRLREENHDLLKLRNEVNQLRDTRVEFQKVSAENQRLRSQPRTTPQTEANQTLIQPIVININALYDRGFNSPEDAVQTF